MGAARQYHMAAVKWVVDGRKGRGTVHTMAGKRATSPSKGVICLLAFGGSWCAPWVVLGPGLAEMVAAGLPVTVIDVDTDPGAASTWRVAVLPTFILCRDGLERQRFTGATTLAALREAVTPPAGRRRPRSRRATPPAVTP